MTKQTDFFARQNTARRNTKLLVLWFILGIVSTAVVVYLLLFLVAGYTGENVISLGYIGGVLLGTFLFIGSISLFKQLELSGAGGGKIAEDLGGTKISPDTSDPAERRLINVVQEMAIASGVPVPDVYVLYNESCINAFAAGTRQENSAIAVTVGALEKLSRDELQGVIGHEFSHILNGDMRLNIKLLGWIFGLIAISMLGGIILRFAVFSGRPRSRGKRSDGIAIILIVGIALYIIGLCSQFFGKIIQAAISRQREHLADASATQFTRNPTALANALARIGGDTEGSKLQSPKATEYAHFFFASGFSSIFATHPPLKRRIKLLNPNWNGNFLPPLKNNFFDENPPSPPPQSTTGDALAIDYTIRQLAQTSAHARALVFMILMTDNPHDNETQARFLLETESRESFKILEDNWEKISTLPMQHRIDAVLLAAPALREMSSRERKTFCEKLRQLANADGQISLFEFCLLRAVEGILFPTEITTFMGTKHCSLERSTCIVLNLFLRQNQTPKPEWQKLLSSATSEQNVLPKNLSVLSDNELTIDALDATFDTMKSAPISFKEQLLCACQKVVLADGRTSDAERDLLNALSAALSCPLLAS